MENTDKKTGERLEEILISKGYTHASFAKEIGVNRSNVKRWCEGTQQIRSENLTKILDKLGITAVDLFGENDKVIFIHDSFKMALMIPEEIYKYAREFSLDHPVWGEIKSVFENAKKDGHIHTNHPPKKNHS